jgi:flagellar biosynthetic protein FliR
MIFEVELFKVFVLVIVRFSGMIVAAPVLGSRNFPVLAKAGLAALSALVVLPALPASSYSLPDDPVEFALIGAGELLIGLGMGFVMTMVFAAIQVAGELMDMQTGFSLMNVFNPAVETQVPIFGFFFFILAVLYLLALNGHHMMIKAMASTFQEIPIGGFVLKPELVGQVSTWGSAMFYDGLLIAAPVTGAMMLTYLTMGLAGRVVPQIQLFVVGFPITISIGLLVAAVSVRVYLTVLEGTFHQMFRDVSTFIRGMT